MPTYLYKISICECKWMYLRSELHYWKISEIRDAIRYKRKAKAVKTSKGTTWGYLKGECIIVWKLRNDSRYTLAQIDMILSSDANYFLFFNLNQNYLLSCW